MTTTILIIFCVLLLTAYLFDISASKTRIPAVLMMMMLGWTMRQVAGMMGTDIPDLALSLPILGTIGLILIVLEGSLELEIRPEKYTAIRRSLLVALIPLLLLSFGIAAAFSWHFSIGYKAALANAIPLAIISSAIAIPSARNLSVTNREFITYESSFSDIIGVLLFNFITANETIGLLSGGIFAGQLLIILAVTAVATILLAFLLQAIKHPIKFTPIILMVILVYTLAKVFHLPGLIFILAFGLYLSNFRRLNPSNLFGYSHTGTMETEVHRFKDIVTEIAFLVRSLFFLVFGYLIETPAITDMSTLPWAAGICVAVFAVRFAALKLTGQSIRPLVFIAPRGLITILLFLSIPVGEALQPAGNSLIIQVILISGLVMMSGLIFDRTGKIAAQTEQEPV